jgi:hypothetical protein
VIEEPDGVHEKFETDSESDSEDGKKIAKRKVDVFHFVFVFSESVFIEQVLHMEMAKFDNDQITKELKKGFWLGVMADGPLIPEVRKFESRTFLPLIFFFFSCSAKESSAGLL